MRLLASRHGPFPDCNGNAPFCNLFPGVTHLGLGASSDGMWSVHMPLGSQAGLLRAAPAACAEELRRVVPARQLRVNPGACWFPGPVRVCPPLGKGARTVWFDSLFWVIALVLGMSKHTHSHVHTGTHLPLSGGCISLARSSGQRHHLLGSSWGPSC